MDMQTITERAQMLEQSDAVCEGCGRDPRNAMDAPYAYQDPAWFMDRELLADAYTPTRSIVLVTIRCPECW